jgi:hypothetical protein
MGAWAWFFVGGLLLTAGLLLAGIVLCFMNWRDRRRIARLDRDLLRTGYRWDADTQRYVPMEIK